MRKLFFLALIMMVLSNINALSAEVKTMISLKKPGNPAKSYVVGSKESDVLPVKVTERSSSVGDVIKVELTITATDDAYYNIEQEYVLTNMQHSDCEFYMPGFWYHKNLRSPKEAPSFHTSDSWQVREDRLSVPLTGIYNDKTGEYYTVLRVDEFKHESLSAHNQGELILTGKTSLGSTGFRNVNGKPALVYSFPYAEAPKTYIRKLTLNPPVQAFEKISKGETKTITWQINRAKVASYSDFVAQVWNYSYDSLKPKVVKTPYDSSSAKKILSNFFVESYVDNYDIKYYSGVHVYTDNCDNTGIAEVGFVGRVLLNAFNALEYGEETGNKSLVNNANAIFDSYLANGFSPNGFFREVVNFTTNTEERNYSIRRQSEGVFAILNYLDYEKKQGRKHPEWEAKMKHILSNFLKIQESNGSFPRKFDDNLNITDASGGSTPSATLPLTMAYKYFKDKSYLESAKKTADYLESELISKADYFSSTLDANCEDKEASLYASTAMYYLSMVTKGKEREHYIDLCKESAYFCLSWYYMWDVPFAQGQMLGDVGFQSRGWGNVSVENNHIDVFIFEFATVLDWLAEQRNEPRFSEFSDVIKTSMFQLMPAKDSMFNIGKVGYYPEVVQHTNWDYGKNGKGFYNDIFAPGWTVASLWQMLCPNRVEEYFSAKR